jgi:hypothetical protein
VALLLLSFWDSLRHRRRLAGADLGSEV